MDYITRLYQSKALQLQEQVNFLEAQLQHLAEDGNTSIFSGTGKGQQTFNDEQLKDQMRQHKRSGFFGAEVADDKQSQEYRDARDELARRSQPTKPDSQSQIIIRTPPMFPQAKAPAKAPAKEKESGSVPDTGADAGGYGPPSSLYEPPVQDTPIAPPANASPRVQATDADGKPSNTPEARGNLQKAAMNPSGAYTPTPKTNERRNREEAERQGFWKDGADHGSARPAEPTAPQKEFEVSTQQPTTGVGPTGETLPQAEKRVAAYKKSGMGDLQKAWKNAATPRYSAKPGSDNSGADTQEDQTANNWKAGQFVNNLLYNRKFKGEQDARTPAQDPDMATGAYSQKPAWAQAKERAIDSWSQGSLPNNSGGMQNSNQNYGKGQDSDVQRGQFNTSDPASPQQMSTQDNRPTSGRKPNYPSSTNDLLRLYGVK